MSNGVIEMRDELAKAALVALVSGCGFIREEAYKDFCVKMSGRAYMMADAMLRERENWIDDGK